MPPCDVLVIAGDVCPFDDHGLAFQLRWLDTEFRAWLERQPATCIVGIAGNHDFVFECWPDVVEKLHLPWFYLQDSTFLMDGVKFHGVPWVPNLSGWAFHGDDTFLDEKFAQIDDNVDVVISHGPPHMYRDLTVPRYGGVHAGFPGANDMLERVRPAALVCGHIHEGYGIAEHPSGATIYNVSRMTENYEPINGAITIAPKRNH